MNINSTFTSTRTAITVNTAQVWTSKAMAQRCRPMLRCALCDRQYSALPVKTRSLKSTEKSTIELGKKWEKNDAPTPLHTTRCNSYRHGKRCIILTIIIVISLHRDFSPLVNTCRCFASSPKPTDSQANRFSKQTRERLCAGCSQLPSCLPVSGDHREIGCEAERRSCSPLILISAPLLDYRHQPSPTVGGGAQPAPR